MAVPHERQDEFILRLAAAEQRQEQLLEQLARAEVSVAAMRRLVVAAVTRRQDARTPFDVT